MRVVAGEEHLTAARPCVFVFNHQSKLDGPIIMSLLRTEFTAVAKKEVRAIPVIGQLMSLMGTVLIDRADPAGARAALTPAVEKLRTEGVSLVIAPEGTRSPTPKLGSFKKGAFHIAMQAGVPMVPIVLRGAGELMWRSAQTVRRGTVEVCVLPPVDTSRWRAETVDDHVAEVRGMFERTLADWPDGRPAE